MQRIVQPLKQMGAQIMGRQDESLAPLTVRGGNLKGIEYDLPMASAQVKSAIMLAALSATGDTVIHQPALSRDHTERMMHAMGADITRGNERLVGGEPVADLSVRASALRGVAVPADRAPSMINEYPVLAMAAAVAPAEPNHSATTGSRGGPLPTLWERNGPDRKSTIPCIVSVMVISSRSLGPRRRFAVSVSPTSLGPAP